MHNLYFPYFRIFLMLALFYGLYLLSLGKQDIPYSPPVSPEVAEEDWEEYRKVRSSWNESIEYYPNGENRNYGNLLGMEPYFLPLDFYSEETFYNSLKPLFVRANQEKAIDRKTLVVLPEHLGTGLVLLGEKRFVYQAKSIEELFQQLGKEWKNNEEFRKKLIPFLKLQNQEEGNPTYSFDVSNLEKRKEFLQAWFRSKSPIMAKVYHSVLSRLAKEYNVSILAGSIVLENPDIVSGNLVSTPGDLYNVSVAYIGNGTCVRPLFKKSILSSWEEGIIQPGKKDQEKILRVPAWTVGVFLSEESQEEDFYKRIGSSQKLDGIVSPASAFQTYKSRPSDKELREILETFQKNWNRKEIRMFIQNTRAKDHIQVFWKGELWNVIPLGESFTYRSLETKVKGNTKPGIKILNVYY